ncbi:MAG: leucine-rich repeat domain-containing protein [Dysgonamonadaceae bacterium]|jgi:hypothetical protein|nr:leucine-rich repeat domain-containing protein [Dysgonamonadaceae bacterium]
MNYLKLKKSACNGAGVMETETISKNGASPKGQKSRKNFKFPVLIAAAAIAFMFAGCEKTPTVDDSGECGTGLTYEYTSSNKTLTIIGTGDMADFSNNSVPWIDYKEEIENVRIEEGVTRIGDYAFYECTELKGFSVPNTSVLYIGENAFYGCSKLQEIDFGKTFPEVKFIDYYAFAECTGLKRIIITGKVTTIEEHAFYNCSNDTLLRIGNSVTEINSSAFNNCGITNVIFEDGTKNIAISRWGIFENCPIKTVHWGRNMPSAYGSPFEEIKSLISATIGGEVTEIMSDIFRNCTNLTSVTIPTSLKDLSSGMFYGCINLTNFIIPDWITSIDASAFAYSGLTSVKIPAKVTGIGDGAFNNTEITDIVIEDGTTDLAISRWGIFNNCPIKTIYWGRTIPFGYSSPAEGVRSLTSVIIGAEVTSINSDAFSGCTKLTQLTSKNPNPPAATTYTFSNFDQSSCSLFVPASAINAYKNATGWKDFSSITAGAGI